MSEHPALPPGIRYRDARLHTVVLMQDDYLELRTGARLGEHIYRGPLLRSVPAPYRIGEIRYVDWDTDSRTCTLLDSNAEQLAELTFTVWED
jgi:hypothetical protein